MKPKGRARNLVIVLTIAGGCVTAAALLGFAGTPLSAFSDDDGQHRVHITKECSQYTGVAGSFCTITSSDLSLIGVGSSVFYDQAAGIPAGLLDSNIVLDAGNGNRALGRCTLDLGSGLGRCTFSDGTGDLRGIHAQFDVTPPSDGVHWHWDGTYT